MKNPVKYTVFSMLACTALGLSACSTVLGSNDRTVTIKSPKGATVSVNQVVLSKKTPTTVVVTNMWSPTRITVTQPGCQPKTVTIQPEFQTIGLLNIFVLPGFIVDAATGDMMKIPDNQRTLTVFNC